MKVAIPFGNSFAGVLADARKNFTITSLLVIVTSRDEVTLTESSLSWEDRRDGHREVSVKGVEVQILRMPAPQDGVLDLGESQDYVKSFAPDVVVLNGGTTPQQALLWGACCRHVDLQRDGLVEIKLD